MKHETMQLSLVSGVLGDKGESGILRVLAQLYDFSRFLFS